MKRKIKPELIEIIDKKIGEDSKKIACPKDLLRASLKALVGVHEEGGNNKGKIVELFQSTCGAPVRQAWCMDFQQSAISYVEFKLNCDCPLPATESTIYMADWAKKQGRAISYPIVDSLVIWKHIRGTGGHVGYVLSAGAQLETIEGNTGPSAGVEREGDGVYAKKRDPHKTGDMLVMCYVPVQFQLRIKEK